MVTTFAVAVLSSAPKTPVGTPALQRVARVSAFLSVGFCRRERPTANHSTIDRAHRRAGLQARRKEPPILD